MNDNNLFSFIGLQYIIVSCVFTINDFYSLIHGKKFPIFFHYLWSSYTGI